MSLSPPNYWSLSHEPPNYSDIVTSSLAPPYIDSIGSSNVNLPSDSESSSTSEEVHEDSHHVERCCVFSWILLLAILAVLHLILFGIYVKCPLPGTDLGGIRTILFLHIIFCVGMFIYFGDKCIRRSAIESFDGVLVTIFFFVPTTISLFLFFPIVINDLVELNEAIRRPLDVTNTYPCSLSFYRLIFVVVICNYVFPTILLTFSCLRIAFLTYRRQFFNPTYTPVLLHARF